MIMETWIYINPYIYNFEFENNISNIAISSIDNTCISFIKIWK